MGLLTKFKHILHITDPVIEKLVAETKDSYSPFTKKMLGSDITIRTTYFDNNYVALLDHNIVTGQADTLELNEKFDNKGAAFSTEHEGVHYDQSKVDFRYNSSLYTKVEDRYKIDRVKELEAYGREYHKIIQDHLKHPLSREEIFNTGEDDGMYRQGLMHYVEIYGGAECDDDEESILIALDAIREQNIRKEPIDVLPEFMYRRSFDESFMDRVSMTTFKNQFFIVKNLFQDPMLYAKTVSNAVAPLAIFQKEIGLCDADRLLNRNGEDYLGRLGDTKKQEFWQNVEALNPKQSKIVDAAADLFSPYIPRFDKKPV